MKKKEKKHTYNKVVENNNNNETLYILAVYREGFASVNNNSIGAYLSMPRLLIRVRCSLSVFAAIGWQGATIGGDDPIASERLTMKFDHSSD